MGFLLLYVGIYVGVAPQGGKWGSPESWRKDVEIKILGMEEMLLSQPHPNVVRAPLCLLGRTKGRCLRTNKM